ncbi:MAG: AI-2E family transporter [Lachnospiraceae bacterium]|nr:AI-2E family transporter [Lachnospiraceae bacterium]
MVRPDKKLKKILLLLGITGAVYGSFKYLLPLVVPFLLAYATALCLRPSVRFFEYRIRISFRGKRHRLPAVFIGGIELILLYLILLGLLYVGGRLLISQLGLLSARLPQWLSQADMWLTRLCQSAEELLGLKGGYLVELAREMTESLGAALRRSTMPALMNNSMTAFHFLAEAVVFSVIYFVAVLLSLQEMEELCERRSRSVFHRELSLVGRRLVTVGNAWLKSQLVIMLMTTFLCILGLFLIGNPYSVLLGIGIGLLDALPIFGTGTVLLPWGIFSLVQRRWRHGVVILGLYIVCYFLRQLMEAKIMGNQVGLSALESLLSMYVGFKLFGIIGFLLGPIGFLIIEDLLSIYGEQNGMPC